MTDHDRDAITNAIESPLLGTGEHSPQTFVSSGLRVEMDRSELRQESVTMRGKVCSHSDRYQIPPFGTYQTKQATQISLVACFVEVRHAIAVQPLLGAATRCFIVLRVACFFPRKQAVSQSISFPPGCQEHSRFFCRSIRQPGARRRFRVLAIGPPEREPH